MLQDLQNMANLEKIIPTLHRVALKSCAMECEKQQHRNIEENNRVVQQLGIPRIIIALGEIKYSAWRQRKRGTEEGGDSMPLEDEGDEAAAATKASMSRITAELEL